MGARGESRGQVATPLAFPSARPAAGALSTLKKFGILTATVKEGRDVWEGWSRPPLPP